MRLTKSELETTILALFYAQQRKLYPWSLEDMQNMATAMKKLRGIK